MDSLLYVFDKMGSANLALCVRRRFTGAGPRHTRFRSLLAPQVGSKLKPTRAATEEAADSQPKGYIYIYHLDKDLKISASRD